MNDGKTISESSILYDDSNIVVVNKLPGIAVIPARGEDSALSLKMQLETLLGLRLYVVHRIDRATSGIVVFAKNADVHSEICRLFTRREVEKEYIALVDGCISDNVICNEPIRQFGSGRMGVHLQGKSSRTSIEVIKKFEDLTLVRAFPHTGRRHQIRVHLYHHAHPIIGDILYGEQRPVRGATRLMLHAFRLRMTLHSTGTHTFTAPFGTTWTVAGSSFTGVVEETVLFVNKFNG